jgi:hypothetical protein
MIFVIPDAQLRIWRQTGLRKARPDDRLRAEPGIQYSQVFFVLLDSRQPLTRLRE